MKKGEVIKFSFYYTYLKKRYKAAGTMFQMVKKPQVYVALPTNDLKSSEVFTFYKIDEPDNMFYWFKHQGEKEGKATAIAKGLERYFVKQKAA